MLDEVFDDLSQLADVSSVKVRRPDAAKPCSFSLLAHSLSRQFRGNLSLLLDLDIQGLPPRSLELLSKLRSQAA